MLLFEEEQFPRFFVGPFIHVLLFEMVPERRSVSYSKNQQEKIGGGGMAEMMVGSDLLLLMWTLQQVPRICLRAPCWDFLQSSSYHEVAQDLHICPLGTSCEVSWGGMENAGRNFSLVHYQGNKRGIVLDGITHEASPVSCSDGDQYLHHIWTGRWKFPFRSTQTVVFDGSSKQDLPKVKSLGVIRHMRVQLVFMLFPHLSKVHWNTGMIDFS